MALTSSIEFIEGGESKGPDLRGLTSVALSPCWDIFIEAIGVDFCVTFVSISKTLELGGMEVEPLLCELGKGWRWCWSLSGVDCGALAYMGVHGVNCMTGGEGRYLGGGANTSCCELAGPGGGSDAI